MKQSGFPAKVEKETVLQEKLSTLYKQTGTIRQFLNLSSTETPKSLEQILTKSISDRKDNPAKLTVSLEKRLQKFMLTVFLQQMGSWKSEIGR